MFSWRPVPGPNLAFWLNQKIRENSIKSLELPPKSGIYTRLPAHCRFAWNPDSSEVISMRHAASRSNLLVPEIREVMDIRQASDYLGISPDTLYKYASEGFVPAFKLGNRWRFKKSRLDDWMDQQSSASMAPQDAKESVAPERKKPVRSAGR